MDNVAKKLKDTIGGLTEILIVAIGLPVVQVVFGTNGENAGIDIIGNITGVVDSFIGSGASLASLVALLIVMAVLGRKTSPKLHLSIKGRFRPFFLDLME